MVRNIYKGGRPDDYAIGRGRLLVADASLYVGYVEQQIPDRVYRDVGNCTAFTISQESEVKEHTSYLSGIATRDLEVPISNKMSISFQLDEQSMANLGRFLSGDVWNFENGAVMLNAAAVDSATGALAGSENFWVDTAVTEFVYDQWYPIALTTLVGTVFAIDFQAQASQAIEVRRNPTTRTSTDGTVLTEGTHYEIDRKAGMIRFPAPGSGLQRGDIFRVKWPQPSGGARSATPGGDDELVGINILTNSGKTVAIRFIGENPNANGLVTVFDAWSVKLRPDGELSMIGDDWGTMGFTGALQAIANPPVQSSPYGRMLRRNVYST